MSKKTINDIFAEAARTAVLTAHERDAMRASIRECISFDPIRTKERTQSISFKSLFDTVTFRYVPAFIIAGLVFSGAGVSYAAEGALPGDLLYPVKLNVNEEIVSVLTADPIDRAVWEAARAERRLSEVGALAKAGLLNTETIAIASDSFAEQAEKAVQNVAELSKANPAAAAEVTAELESALETHEMILASLSTDAPESDVKGIAAKARAEAKRVTMLREEVESGIVLDENEPALMAKGMETMTLSAPSSTEEHAVDAKTQKAAQSMKEAAERAFAQFTKQAKEHTDEAEVENLLSSLTEELSYGIDALGAQNPGEAYLHFRTVLSQSTRAVRVLEAEERLDITLPIGEEFPEQPAPEESVDDSTVNPDAPSIEEATSIKTSAQNVFAALDTIPVDELSTSEATQFKRNLKEARAYMVRGDLAVGGGDGFDAVRLYERATEKATKLLKDTAGAGTTSPAIAVVEDPDAVLVANTVHHSQLNGVHVFEGLVRTPTPCYEVTADTLAPRNGQITLVVKWKEKGGMCTQLTMEKQFSASKSGQESDQLTTVYVNGKKVEGFKVLEVVEEPVASTSASGTATTATDGFVIPTDEILKRVNDMLKTVSGS